MNSSVPFLFFNYSREFAFSGPALACSFEGDKSVDNDLVEMGLDGLDLTLFDRFKSHYRFFRV